MTKTADRISPGILDVIEGIRDPIKDDVGDPAPPHGWPKSVWVLAYSTGHYGCLSYVGTHGLAVFKKRTNCVEFAKAVRKPPSRAWLAKNMPFDEARKLAKEKAAEHLQYPILAMILVDGGPLILYVN